MVGQLDSEGCEEVLRLAPFEPHVVESQRERERLKVYKYHTSSVLAAVPMNHAASIMSEILEVTFITQCYMLRVMAYFIVSVIQICFRCPAIFRLE